MDYNITLKNIRRLPIYEPPKGLLLGLMGIAGETLISHKPSKIDMPMKKPSRHMIDNPL